MKKDWADRIILKLGRKYTKDETVAGLREMLSKILVELGKSEAYCAELEDKVRHLEGRLNFPNDMEKRIRSLEQELKRTKKKANFLERSNQLILSRQKASGVPFEVPPAPNEDSK